MCGFITSFSFSTNSCFCGAKRLEINYFLGREWELPQINKPETKYPTSSSIYKNENGSASITFGNYKTINIELESNSETKSIHVNAVNVTP